MGKFFVLPPDLAPMTEEEALHEAEALVKQYGKRIYIAEYRNHVDPEEVDA